MTEVHAAAVAVVAHGLAGSRVDLPAAPLDEQAWFDLVQECRRAHLVSFLAASVAHGDLAVTADQAEELSVLEVETAGLSLLVDQRVLTMCSVLSAAGIEHRVVDGPARHRLAYGGSALRTYDSAELVVPADHIDAAVRLAGARLTFRPGVLPEAWVGDHVGVDYLSEGVPVRLADRLVVGLTIDEQLVVSCVELAIDRFSPLWLLRVRDVAALALSPQVDPAHVRHLAERWQVAEVVAEMIALVWQVFDLADKTELSVWALRRDGARLNGAPRRRRALDRSTGRSTARATGRPDRAARTSGWRPEPAVPTAARRYR